MIGNLYDLNDTINAVCNRALDIVAHHSTSGQRYIDHSDVADLISREDFIKYADFICYELSGRKEVLEPVTLDDGQLDINMYLAYCHAYEWCDGDEKVFGCSREEWEQNFKPEPISHPLSLTRMAELGHSAVAHILESSDVAIDDLTECVGMSLDEVREVTGVDLYEEPTASYEYQLMDVARNRTFVYSDFEAALKAYHDLGNSDLKTLSVILPENAPWEGAVAILQQQNSKDVLCNVNTSLDHVKGVRDFFAGTEVEGAFARAAEYVERQIPIYFYVNCASFDQSERFDDFDAALARYKSIPPNTAKSLDFLFFDAQRRGHGAMLLQNFGRGADHTCRIGKEALENPHIALAHAKSVISCYPFDEKAWKLRDEAEAKLGIADRIVDTSKDLTTGKWRAHVVPTGGHYGLHNHLINEDNPLVEFYDMSQNKESFPEGQFVSRYDVDTILGKDGWYQPAYNQSLCLDLACPEWTISAEEMKQIVDYLKTFDRNGHVRHSLNDKISAAQSQQQNNPDHDRKTFGPDR